VAKLIDINGFSSVHVCEPHSAYNKKMNYAFISELNLLCV